MCFYNSNCTLNANGFTKTGHSFEGWATSSSGSVVYGNGGTGKFTADTTLYAKWKASTYTLTYSNNGGSGCSTTSGTYGETWGTLCTPSRDNYEFNGWYDGSTKVTESTTVSGDRTVTASWKAIAPTCGTVSGHNGSWSKSKTVYVGCTNPDGTACTTVTGTYTSSGSKSLTITGSNSATRSCSFTVSNIDTSTPTLTYNGQVVSGGVKCPEGSAYTWLDSKWTFTITNTASGFRESGSNLVVTMPGIGSGTHNYGAPKASSGSTFGCAYFSYTEFGFARSGKPNMTATACNNVGNCGSKSG